MHGWYIRTDKFEHGHYAKFDKMIAFSGGRKKARQDEDVYIIFHISPTAFTYLWERDGEMTYLFDFTFGGGQGADLPQSIWGSLSACLGGVTDENGKPFTRFSGITISFP